MRDIADLIPFVQIELPDANDSLSIHYLRLGAIEFSRFGILEDRQSLDLQAGVAFYPIILGDCRRISRVVEVRYCGRCITQVDERCRNGNCNSASSGYSLDSASQLQLHGGTPIEDVPGGLEIRYRWEPTIDSCQIPDDLFDAYADGIAAYAVGRLAGQADEAWSSKDVAQRATDRFRRLILRARADRDRQFGVKALVVRPKRPFMAGRRSRSGVF